jgi:tRNA uridine 5-carbamoylmethylation protein Kti12
MAGTVYIIRGLPGSGKTTLASEFGGIICEADQYFIDKNGAYKFDATKLAEAHNFCKNRFIEAITQGYNRITVSNTSSRRWEIDYYINTAKIYEYQIVEITLTGPIHDNIHKVPEETIQAMKDRWER